GDAKITFYEGAGCDACGETGYKGRAGLYEVMAMTPAMRQLILRGGSTDEIRELAIEEGMLTLRMDGMKKVEQGVTSLGEVLKETAA
ncbi:MAG: type II secretion system protein GspE, partial [Gemmatimonadales bacterium]